MCTYALNIYSEDFTFWVNTYNWLNILTSSGGILFEAVIYRLIIQTIINHDCWPDTNIKGCIEHWRVRGKLPACWWIRTSDVVISCLACYHLVIHNKDKIMYVYVHVCVLVCLIWFKSLEKSYI